MARQARETQHRKVEPMHRKYIYFLGLTVFPMGLHTFEPSPGWVWP